MKKILSTILAILMVFSIFPVSAFANEDEGVPVAEGNAAWLDVPTSETEAEPVSGDPVALDAEYIDSEDSDPVEAVSEQSNMEDATHEHSFSGRWITTLPATCEADGVEANQCDICGELVYKSIAAIGHNYGEWTELVAAGCVTPGTEVRVCANCKNQDNRKIEPTGHEFGEWYSLGEYSCNDFYVYGSCTKCSTFESEFRTPKGHSFENGVCTECGYSQNTFNYTDKNGIEYVLDSNGTLTVSGIGVAAGIEYYSDLHKEYNSVKNIVINEGITGIEYQAFRECIYATSITLPNSLRYIENEAFCMCFNLEEVNIPANVAVIGSNAFTGCRSAINVNSSNQYFASENGVLYSKDFCTLIACPTSFKSLTVHGGANTIGRGAFTFCTNLQSVSLPESVTRIEAEAFGGCTSLKSVSLPSSLESIGNGAFASCKSLESADLPDSLEIMEDSIFNGCAALKSVKLPANIKTIPHACFSDCTSLETFEIPYGVETIGESAFSRCSSLESVTIPDTVNRIEGGAFSVCGSLRNIVVPDSVNVLGGGAFWDCYMLTDVKLSNNITQLRRDTFFNCYSLRTVSLPQQLKYIENDTFFRCTALESLTIPANVSFFEFSVSNCEALKEITFLCDSHAVKMENYNAQPIVCYYPDSWEEIPQVNGVTWKSLTAANGVENGISWVFYSTGVLDIIGNGAIADYYPGTSPWSAYGDEIKTVYINDGVTAIGNNAFYGCNNMNSVSIPDSVGSIGNNAFNGCSALREIDIPASVTFLGDYAFANSGLESVVFRGSKPDMGTEVFDGATFTVFYPIDWVTVPDSESFGGTVTPYYFTTDAGSCGDNASWSFDGATGTLTISGSGEIDDYAQGGNAPLRLAASSPMRALASTKSATSVVPWAKYQGDIKNIVVDDGITAIGNNAFANFFALDTVNLPKTLTAVGEYAFGGCMKLASIIFGGTEDEWSSIAFGNGNSYATSANISVIHAHKFVKTVRETSCACYGATVYTCSCGYSYEVDPVAATEHNFVVEDVPATCQAAGYTRYACSSCGYTYEEDHPQLSHHLVYVPEVVATPNEPGHTFGYYCDYCGMVYIECKTIEYVCPGHQYDATMIAPADCAHGDTYLYTCRICGDSYTYTAPEALGHSYDENDICTRCGMARPHPVFYIETPSTTTVKYGQVLTLYLHMENIPEEWSVSWAYEGNGGKATFEGARNEIARITCTKSGTMTITARLIDETGNIVYEDGVAFTDSLQITMKANFIYKIIAWFKNLFGINNQIQSIDSFSVSSKRIF